MAVPRLRLLLDEGMEHKLGQHFRGASITVASIGVIAKVLSELGYLKRAEGKLPWVLWYS